MVAKVRIPKRIGAVKVPRKIRKKANRAIKAATGPLVRDFATAAVAAAARSHTRGSAGGAGAGTGVRTETVVEIDGDRIGEAFRSAAISAFRRFLEGFEEGLRKVQAEGNEDRKPEPGAEPKAAAKPRAAAPASAKAPAKKSAAKPGAPAKPKPRGRANGAAAAGDPGVPTA